MKDQLGGVPDNSPANFRVEASPSPPCHDNSTSALRDSIPTAISCSRTPTVVRQRMRLPASLSRFHILRALDLVGSCTRTSGCSMQDDIKRVLDNFSVLTVRRRARGNSAVARAARERWPCQPLPAAGPMTPLPKGFGHF